MAPNGRHDLQLFLFGGARSFLGARAPNPRAMPRAGTLENAKNGASVAPMWSDDAASDAARQRSTG
jgi:hypothetical protein